jgi:hypothetical protein
MCLRPPHEDSSLRPVMINRSRATLFAQIPFAVGAFTVLRLGDEVPDQDPVLRAPLEMSSGLEIVARKLVSAGLPVG